LVISSETEDGVAMAESLVKSLVSGDSMAVRQLHQAPMEFTPLFKLLMAGNHKPIVRGNDNGIWRRVRLVPFARTFSGDEKDTNLLAKLKAETPHILAWMVDGCIRWQRESLSDVPKVIRDATDAYPRVSAARLHRCVATLAGDALMDKFRLTGQYAQPATPRLSQTAPGRFILCAIVTGSEELARLVARRLPGAIILQSQIGPSFAESDGSRLRRCEVKRR
jgi:hypothetical protein